MKFLAYSIIAMFLFVAGVAAQSSDSTNVQNDLSILPPATTIELLGIQNTPGLYDGVNNKCWGNGFVMTGGNKEISTYLTVSMDYVDGLPNPDFGNNIVNGTFSLVVYRNNEYVGVLFGEIPTGTINWKRNPYGDRESLIISRTTEAKFRILGGFDGYKKVGPQEDSLIFMATTQIAKGSGVMTMATLEFPF